MPLTYTPRSTQSTLQAAGVQTISETDLDEVKAVEARIATDARLAEQQWAAEQNAEAVKKRAIEEQRRAEERQLDFETRALEQQLHQQQQAEEAAAKEPANLKLAAINALAALKPYTLGSKQYSLPAEWGVKSREEKLEVPICMSVTALIDSCLSSPFSACGVLLFASAHLWKINELCLYGVICLP